MDTDFNIHNKVLEIRSLLSAKNLEINKMGNMMGTDNLKD